MARDYVADVLALKLPVAVQATPEPPRLLMRESPPADPFPIDALGDALEPAARAIHDRVQAPLAICGQSVLAAAQLGKVRERAGQPVDLVDNHNIYPAVPESTGLEAWGCWARLPAGVPANPT
jgi:hypothetical protein